MGAELWKFCIVSVVYVVLQYGDSVWVEVLVHLMLSAILFCLVSIAATTWRPLAATWHGKRPEKQKRSNASSAKHKRSNMSSLTIPAAKTRKSSGEEIACGLGHPAFSCSQPDVRSSSWTHTWLEKHGFSRTLTEIGSPNKTRTQDSFCDLEVGPRTAAADVPTVPSFIRAEDDSPRKDVKNQHQSTQLFDAAWHGKRPAKHEDISNASSSTMRAARCSRECSGVTIRHDRHTVSAPEIQTPLDRVPVTPTRISWSSSARASATSMMHLRAAIKEGRQAITAPDTPLTRAPVTPTLTEGISRTAGISRVDDAALVMEEMYTADSQANTRRLHKSKSWHCNRHGEASRATRKILPQSPTSQQPRNISGGSRFDAIAVKKRWATSTRSI